MKMKMIITKMKHQSPMKCLASAPAIPQTPCRIPDYSLLPLDNHAAIHQPCEEGNWAEEDSGSQVRKWLYIDTIE